MAAIEGASVNGAPIRWRWKERKKTYDTWTVVARLVRKTTRWRVVIGTCALDGITQVTTAIVGEISRGEIGIQSEDLVVDGLDVAGEGDGVGSIVGENIADPGDVGNFHILGTIGNRVA